MESFGKIEQRKADPREPLTIEIANLLGSTYQIFVQFKITRMTLSIRPLNLLSSCADCAFIASAISR